MGTSGLPDEGRRPEGVYIRRTTSAHGIYNNFVTLYFNVNGFTIFIVVLIAFDCGFRL